MNFANLQGQTLQMDGLLSAPKKYPLALSPSMGLPTASTSESPSLVFAFSKAPVWANPGFPIKACQIYTGMKDSDRGQVSSTSC